MTRPQRIAQFAVYFVCYGIALVLLVGLIGATIKRADNPDLSPCLARCEAIWTAEQGCRPAGWGVVGVEPCRCGVVLP